MTLRPNEVFSDDLFLYSILKSKFWRKKRDEWEEKRSRYATMRTGLI